MARTSRTSFDSTMRRVISLRLERALAQKGWSKTKLAEKSGISPSTLSGYFTAKYNMSPENLDALAKALDIPKEQIDPRAGATDANSVLDIMASSGALGIAAGTAAVIGAPVTATLAAGAALGMGAYAYWQNARKENNHKNLESSIEALENQSKRSVKNDLAAQRLRLEAEYVLESLPQYLEACDKIISIKQELKVSDDLALWIDMLEDSKQVVADLQKEYESVLKALDEKSGAYHER